MFDARHHRSLVFVGTRLALALAPLAAQQGSVAGRVTDQGSGQPLANVRVTVAGTALIAATNAAGRYIVRGVPPGAATVRASVIGYAGGTRTVTVSGGDTATADFALALKPYSLDEVVVTATGEQSRREVGNAISTIRADSLVQRRPIANMNDLLTARAPGVDVLPGNITGAGARVRIRGTSSLSLNNEPIYIIDGIRMESANNSSSIGIGGTNPSRVNDINPEEIESIDVVKGPSASTLYGTAAANGVIVINTKRGTAGPTRFNVYAEAGLIKDYNTYPTAYRGWTTNPRTTNPDSSSQPTNGIQCFLTQTVRASTDPQHCVQDSVTTFNLFEDPDASPNGTGYQQQYGLQVSGGSDVARYFVSGDWQDEIGQLRLPSFASDRILTTRQIGEVPYDQSRPNARKRTSVRLNVQANLNPRMDVAVQTGFVSSTQRLPQTDNNTVGLLSNGFGGPGNKDNGRFGYRLYTPDQFFSETVTQDVNRFIGSATGNWRPSSWLAVRVLGGVDFTNRVDTDLCRRDQCPPINTTYRTGFKQDNRTAFFDYTLNADGTASFELSPTVTSRSTAGVQYVKNLFDRNGAFSENLPPGATTVTAGATPQADETTLETITIGAFVEQEFGYKNRLFVTGGLRTDDNSAFGKNFSAVYYPKLGVSWVISDEPFFPKWSWVNSVRLRGAFGASGVQPGTTDALRFFAPKTSSVDGVDAAAIVDSAIGNQDLKPERAREFEIGGEATLFRGRVNVDFTYYNKRTKDALIARTIAPSVGSSATRFGEPGRGRKPGDRGPGQRPADGSPEIRLGRVPQRHVQHQFHRGHGRGAADHRDYHDAAAGIPDQWVVAAALHLQRCGRQRRHHGERDHGRRQRGVRGLCQSALGDQRHHRVRPAGPEAAPRGPVRREDGILPTGRHRADPLPVAAQLPRGDRPDRAAVGTGAGRGPARERHHHAVRLHRPGGLPPAARGFGNGATPRAVGAGIPGEPPDLHRGGPQPLEDDEVPRRGSGGQLFHWGDRHRQQLPDGPAANLLDVPPERGVLSPVIAAYQEMIAL